MSQALVKFTESLSKSVASRFSRGKRGDLQWAAEKQFALAAINKSDALKACEPESLEHAMLDGAWAGLSLNPITAHAYLIPYDRQITFKPSYRGLEHLVYRAGTVVSIQTVLVHKGDFFTVKTIDNHRIVEHDSRADSTAPVSHVYCILHYTNGGAYVEVMDANELAKVEAQAKSRPGGGKVWTGPWKGEMQRKAVLRRALKHTPLDNAGNLAHAIAVHDKLDPMDFGKPVDREEVEELIDKDQQLRLHAFLTDNGLDGKEADKWLTLLAEAMGFRKIDELPVKHLQEAKDRLAVRYDAWKAKQKA